MLRDASSDDSDAVVDSNEVSDGEVDLVEPEADSESEYADDDRDVDADVDEIC